MIFERILQLRSWSGLLGYVEQPILTWPTGLGERGNSIRVKGDNILGRDTYRDIQEISNIEIKAYLMEYGGWHLA
ncbi:hypothetical protein ONS95_013833 [Cadophora gregata]|uniref:uncharacterized protein n=1 Tax=Cadophora gregata TaxID=51156 RepID=UPI0026DBFFBC|nr:uncharacterized protein ONS95_013833 [Cadophora gregata]KAK0113586.1 hypothetical protein ONS96_014442 [Cadophora gregata f. sp. sojae]KAK0114341.1 hypothetical protein ONS95_013833 [Cadophora gregata]